ncbi:MAG: hypothetical protein WBQ25_12650 [Nitrososphaeraceae archaeon]
MVYNYDPNLVQCFRHVTKIHTTEETGRSKFFIDYHSHSEQLVDALKEWARKLRFTSCKYEQGFFDVDSQGPIESMNKGFMRYMKKHLENEDEYNEQILTPIIEIEANHRQLCEEMKNLMAYGTQVRPSFQVMIVNKIRSFCPKLKNTLSRELEQSNIYIESNIFKLIFAKIANKESIIGLKTIPSSLNNSSILSYRDLFALAQGEVADIEKLKTGIEQLVIDNDLNKKVERYFELEKQLINYEKINEVKDKIDELWTFVHGGGYLGCIYACELCDPSRLAPTRP